MSKMGGECILGLETPSWERRGVGTWKTVRWRPAAALTRVSRLANLPAVSQQPGVARLLNARVRPSLVSSARVGSRVPGAPPPRSRHRDPPQGRRWFGRRPNPERPGRIPQPHPAALTRPRRRPGACHCQLEELAGSNPEPATSRPAHTIARPPAGGITRRRPLHALLPRTAPAPGQSPSFRRLSNPRGPGEETGRQAGLRGAGLGGAGFPPRPGQWKVPAAEAPSGPGGGLCRSLLPLARSRLAMGGGRVLLRARGGGSLREVMAEPGSPETPACSPSVTAAMASKQLFRALVSAQWVAEALRAPQAGQPLRLLDASWYLAKLGRDARREFEERHIPGAAFFDIDQCSDRTSPYDHMLPSAAHFSEYAGRLGVGAATHVVVYDASDQGLYAAPRVWWMFRVFGHRTVSLLDGGLRNWLRQGLPLSSGKSRPQPAEFHAVLDPAYIKTYEDIKENLESRRFQVVDARAAGRFRGTEPEPRDGIEPGHIPGTINIPFTDFLTEDGLEKSPEEIRRLFQDKKVDLSLPLVATCGSGVTACHVALGAYLCGKPDVPIYDGSWVEWYMRAQPEDIISEGRGKVH
uniref:Sulfurtransferase n=3 Tax=Bos indicus x Bos taurus TaxID=30522 RepID=A0A4W2IH51_BOBOX